VTNASSGFGADLPLAERERAYSPSSCIGGNYQPFVLAYATHSASVRQRFAGRLGLAYGASASNTLDLFVPPRASDAEVTLPPLLLFIHGGYWQELSKNESLFAAEGCLAAGAAFAALDYTLAPWAPVAQMVLECRTALRWLHGHAAELGFDATRVVVAGSSAGAHLAAMCCLRGWPGDADLPVGIPAAAVLVSGIYDLAPLVGTGINDALGLAPDSAAAVSPIRFGLQGFPQAVVCWGEIETDMFKRHGRAFAQAIGDTRDGAKPPQVFELAARNHFDVILDLARAGTVLNDATLRLLRGD